MFTRRVNNISMVHVDKTLGHIANYPVPLALTYVWNFGSLAGLCLVLQIFSGLFLAMYYIPHSAEAFDSVQNIMRNIKWGWLMRYTHSNGASIFFMVVYAHIAKAIYIRSFTRGRLWVTGLIIFLLMMATAFLGYVLPWGQMSYWGATVITSLVSVIPVYGTDIVYWLWGGFALNNASLERVYAIHYLLPFIISGIVMLHILLLHNDGGSRHPLGLSIYREIPFGYYFLYKDHTGVLLLLLVYVNFVCFEPNYLGEKVNFIRASSSFTPKHIVPEWYFLPFYAMLRCVPNKIGGVLVMSGSLAILFILPLTAQYIVATSYFDPIYRFFFWCFIFDIFLLGWLGAQAAEEPFVSHSQYATYLYFGYLLIFLPFWAKVENFVYYTKFSNR